MLREQLAYLTATGESVAEQYCSHPNGLAIAESGRRWLSDCVDDDLRCQMLARRVALDPLVNQSLPLALSLRLQDNNVALSQYLQLFDRHYLHDGVGPINSTPWKLPIGEAIAVIQSALPALGQRRLGNLIQQGRLRMVAGTSVGNLCIMTSAGAFIQLAANNQLVDVLAFAHEVGHALDLEQRWQQLDYWPVGIVASEAAAIAMEFHLLAKNQNMQNYTNKLKQQRRQFYGPWHLALHQFELGLYGMEIIDPQSLDRLWQDYTHHFKAAAGGWRNIQHLYTSPFYLICYPLALVLA